MKKQKKMLIAVIFILILFIVTVNMIGILWNSKILVKYSTDNIKIENNTIDINSLSIKQKLSQMIVVSGRRNNGHITRFNIGGIYLFGLRSKQYYTNKINKFDETSRIKLFFSTDMEGYWNPFKRFYDSKTAGEISSVYEAISLGDEHGRILREIGFNMNFAPVAEANGKIWNGRGFTGTSHEIGNKSLAYINALQKNGIISVVKHYPGGSIDTADTHRYIVKRVIAEDDLIPFRIAFLNNVSAVMVGHVVATGKIDSNGKPCSVSKECIDTIKNEGFNGMIITDEVNMIGLSSFYENKDEMYIDLINAGNDVILDFRLNPIRLDRLLNELEKHVNESRIDIKRVDESVTKILKTKGYIVR